AGPNRAPALRRLPRSPGASRVRPLDAAAVSECPDPACTGTPGQGPRSVSDSRGEPERPRNCPLPKSYFPAAAAAAPVKYGADVREAPDNTELRAGDSVLHEEARGQPCHRVVGARQEPPGAVRGVLDEELLGSHPRTSLHLKHLQVNALDCSIPVAAAGMGR